MAIPERTHGLLISYFMSVNSVSGPTRYSFGCDGGGYGCWFYEHDARTSLLYPTLNVTVWRPLLLRDKSEVYPWIDGTVRDADVRRVLAHCLADRRCGVRHSEIGVCAAALKGGYDGVRMPLPTVENRSWKINEWVICRAGCLSTVSCDACPTIVEGPCPDSRCCDTPPPSIRWKEASRRGRQIVEQSRAARVTNTSTRHSTA